MRIVFDCRLAGSGNIPGAIRREAFRMAMCCWCLRQLGHDATLCSYPMDLMARDPRKTLIESMYAPEQLDAHAYVFPMEQCGSRQLGKYPVTVGWKTNKKSTHESKALSICDIAVMHEYLESSYNNPKCFPVPWGCHEDVLLALSRCGLLEDYLMNHLWTIRNRFCRCAESEGEITDRVFFCGAALNGRADFVRRLRAAGLPLDVEFTPESGQKVSGEEYLTKMGKYKFCLHLPGDSPKCNRFSEIVMLGKLVVHNPIVMQETPAVTDKNAILLTSYDDISPWRRGAELDLEIYTEAHRDYLHGWSPMGQAMRLADRMEQVLETK